MNKEQAFMQLSLRLQGKLPTKTKPQAASCKDYQPDSFA